MPNTFTQLHIQFVFAVQYRATLIHNSWKERLHQYITGIVQQNEHKLIQINSMPDHVHLLIGLRPAQSVSSIMKNIKSESSKWINNNRITSERFAWQEGYGAFSYSKSHLPNVIRYIRSRKNIIKNYLFYKNTKHS